MTAPVENDETYVVEIEELGAEGDGVGYVDDFAVLVPQANLGESVRVRVDEVGENFARAELLEREFP